MDCNPVPTTLLLVIVVGEDNARGRPVAASPAAAGSTVGGLAGDRGGRILHWWPLVGGGATGHAVQLPIQCGRGTQD